MDYIISYSSCLIIWASRIQTEIVLSTTDAEYIALYQAMRGVLPSVSLMLEIEFVLKLQVDTMMVICILFEKPVTPIMVYK